MKICRATVTQIEISIVPGGMDYGEVGVRASVAAHAVAAWRQRVVTLD
jgi:hypothetical protein